jgi:hypothetical protein
MFSLNKGICSDIQKTAILEPYKAFYRFFESSRIIDDPLVIVTPEEGEMTRAKNITNKNKLR